MSDLLLIVTMFVICGGCGLPVAYLLPARYAWRVLTAPTFGLAIVSVLSPVTYQWGVTIGMFFVGTLAIAVLAFACYARRLGRELRTVPRRDVWIVVGGWVACLLVLWLPSCVGGDQFTVFQGNPWDTFAYLESSIAYARKSHSQILATSDAMLSRYPFLSLAKTQLEYRPSAHLLYAVFTRAAADDTYRLYYTFLAVWLSQFFLVAVFAIRAVLPNLSPWTCIAIAAVFPLGFWGQYAVDINAWSQVASTPLLLLLFVLLVGAAAGDYSLRLAGAIAVAIAGGLYLYPEGLIIYAVALFPIVGLFALVRMIRARKIELRALIPFGSLLAIVTGVLYAPTLPFLWRQITWSKGVRVSWWEFFQAFFQGRDGQWDSGFAQHADFTAGIAGLYFATPSSSEAACATLQRSAIVFGVFALLAAVGVMVVYGTSAIRAWAAATVMLLAPAAYLWSDANYWPAGKVLSYAAPILLLLLCMTITRVRWLAAAFIAFQLATGFVRIVAARSPDGIHFAPPYPAISYAPSKREIGWDMSGLERHLDRSMKVLVHPTHMWLEQRLIVFLYSRRIPYVKLGAANTYFGDGQNLPEPPIPWTPDVELSVDKLTFVLHFTSGNRPDIRVVARDELR